MTTANPDRWAAPNYASFTGTDATPLQQTFQSLSTYLEKINNSVTIASGTGVTSAVAGTGIGVSSATGAVTFTNSGVTSLVAGTNVTLSASTGAVTVNVKTPSEFTTVAASGRAIAIASPAGDATPGILQFTNNAVTSQYATITATNGTLNLNAATINATGTLQGSSSVTANISTSKFIRIGDWSASSNYGAVNGLHGYLILSNVVGDGNLYLRSNNSGAVMIGAQDSNTLQVGNNTVYVSNEITAGGRYRGTAPNSGAYIQMRSGNATSFNWNGSYQFIVDSTHVKTFTIQHPTKPDHLLVHACTEGPTADVFYRGQAQLKAGICVVTLPDYFEELTELENRSIMLTPIADENGMVANLAAYEIEDGQFLVEQIGGYHVPDQRFWWRVDAVRKNTAFNVEPEKSSVTVHGMGPYTYVESNT